LREYAMAQLEFQTEESTQAAKVRVTPEELTQALTAVEAKSEERSRQLADTISLGDAVQQLGLQVSAEELLAEITAQRSRQLQPRKTATRLVIRRNAAAAIAVGLLMLAFLLILRSMPRSAPALSIPPPAEAALQPTASTGYPLLSEVPDGQTVQCDFPTLKSLAAGTNPATVHVDARPEDPASRLWTVIKHNGKLFVKGWGLQSEALKAVNGQNAVLYASQTFGEVTTEARVPIEVPIDVINGAQNQHTEHTGDVEEVLGIKVAARKTIPSR
jgi:hypothetical protein